MVGEGKGRRFESWRCWWLPTGTRRGRRDHGEPGPREGLSLRRQLLGRRFGLLSRFGSGGWGAAAATDSHQWRGRERELRQMCSGAHVLWPRLGSRSRVDSPICMSSLPLKCWRLVPGIAVEEECVGVAWDDDAFGRWGAGGGSGSR